MNLENELFSFQLLKSSIVLTSFALGSLKCARILSVYQTPTGKKSQTLENHPHLIMSRTINTISLAQKKDTQNSLAFYAVFSPQRNLYFRFQLKHI